MELPNVIRFCVYGKTYALEYYDKDKTKLIVSTLNAELKKMSKELWKPDMLDVLRTNMRKKFECEIFDVKM